MSTKDAERAPVPSLHGQPPAVLLVRAPYYRDIVGGLSDGAVRILVEAGRVITIVDVAGAFELPQAIRLALNSSTPFDGFVALGCVIRGETSHYDHICDATMTGLMDLALTHGVALGTGLLTVENAAQAEARAQGPGGSNKGEEAAIACLGQIAIARRFPAAR
jgi:6,7-dimethyl-8-ribityllumazine synthase